MLAPWVVEEMQEADLNDKRLDKRLNRLLSDLSERPTASIPAACGGKNETTAAYNFFNNHKATPRRILDPHSKKTQERVAAQAVAILVPDTTELDLTRPRQQVEGTGPLDDGARRGALVHLMEAFSEDGTPLGAIWSEMWTRDEPPPETIPPQPPRNHKLIPIEDKESYRWLESLRQARAVAEQAPRTRVVVAADSESDIYEVFVEPRGEINPVHWLIRASQDRALETAADDSTAPQLWAGVSAAAVLFTREITVRAHQPKTTCEQRQRRQARTARQATVEVRAARLELRPPYRPGKRLPAVTVHVVQAREIDPPAGEEPVEWVLVTTLPIDTLDDVRKIIQYYTVRWMIEVFFRVLKSGCRVEQRRFEHIDRALTFVAVSLIVAWRVLMVCRLGRSQPELDCEAVFEPSEWKSVYVAVHQRPAPEPPPRLGEMIRLIARLGGYVDSPGRKDPPGPQTLWLGMQRMSDLAWAWESFGPGANAGKVSGPARTKLGRERRPRGPSQEPADI